MQTGASAGRLLYIYLNGKPLLISDEIAQRANTSFTICTDHFRMHQSFQMVWETFKVGKQPCQPCCHHQDDCVTLPASSPSQTCHVLCSNSLGAPELRDSSVIWWLPLQNISTFFFCCELWHAAQQPWGGGWSLHAGAEDWGGESIWTSLLWWWWAFGSAAMQYISLVEYPKHPTVPQHSNC